MNLRYRSTRATASPRPFTEALLQGLAEDGGLFVPETIPSLPDPLPSNGWASRAYAILRPWIDDEIPDHVLKARLDDALNFPLPLVALRGKGWSDTYILELFHGPTLSFKDVGARTMARLMSYVLLRRGTQRTILVATSGDTGSAVADGFAGLGGVSVLLLYPHGKVSPVQEQQIVARRPGVRALAIEGSFDDCQRLVKQAFQDEELRPLALSSANSINVGRLLPQMLYYVEAARTLERPAVFCVPSGNLGNLTGGILAHLAGMPAEGFIAAHNANRFFPDFLAGKEATPADTLPTLSNAMDVGVPSNFERLSALLSEDAMRRHIWGTSISDEETLRTMREVYETTGYLADPHTAVGLAATRRYREVTGSRAPVVVLATAHPAKFPETVARATGRYPRHPRLERLLQRPARPAAVLPARYEALKAHLLQEALV